VGGKAKSRNPEHRARSYTTISVFTGVAFDEGKEYFGTHERNFADTVSS
jgi:hypothetical protein